MEPRIYHGEITPDQIAEVLTARFNRGNLRALQYGQGKQVIVQIGTRPGLGSGGQTALTVTLQKVADGISVQMGKQNWFGVAASLGTTALATLRNPFGLLGRLDDLAQDIESIRLTEEVFETVGAAARAAGASFELSERLKRMVCEYCNSANPVGEACCLACGAPLGSVQPTTCPRCGFVIKTNEPVCPNCRAPIL
jgi:DNA-directed RNA polymerase subunit RPC12/RpoP